MATIKVVLHKKRNKNGELKKTHPLAIRIIKDRKPAYIHLGYRLAEKDWDDEAQRVKKSHLNSTRLNNFIIQELAKVTDNSLELETSHKQVSSKAIKQKAKPKAGKTFFAQAAFYLQQLYDGGKYNQYTADKPRVTHFKEFLSGNDIAFSDITVGLLERYRMYLETCHLIEPKKETANKSKRKPKPKKERTILNHLVLVRSVFSQAIDEKIIDEKYYPFGKGKISIKFPPSTKVGLSKKDVEKIESVQLENSSHDHARNLWLIAFYFAGMRVSDVLRLRWSDFQDMRLHYTMGKNEKPGSLKSPEKALRIIEKYASQKRTDNDLIFPELKRLPNLDDNFIMERTIAFATSRCDKFLRLHVAPAAKVTGKLTMHIARHTFAELAGDKIPIQMLQKLYRHSSITTTIGYQANFIHKDADEALDAVLGA